MYRPIPYLIVALFLSACTTQMTTLDTTYPPVPPEKVTVVFNEQPKCNAKQIAFVNTNTAWAWSQDTALKSARAKAAAIGADYLVINQTRTINQYSDTVFHAVAYKCVKG